ncbi:Os11g0222560 [Oryza sativa Japonica Group]|uniref:Os11g0222560 protein n=1 Tax=Oryza sativa subsp. japonica TaxID=39947 RepID=A0A0P0Y0C7_ORYSJ|nr:Os11g0222560 [Oryza sativa Japonica Group]
MGSRRASRRLQAAAAAAASRRWCWTSTAAPTDMALPTANYILEVGARRDGVSCWGVQRSPAAGTSIIGNIISCR